HDISKRSAMLWESETLREPRILDRPAWGLVISADSQYLGGYCDPKPPGRLAWVKELLTKKPAQAPTQALQLWELATGKELADYAGCTSYEFFPDGRLATWRDNTLEIWDVPPKRAWWIEYGLPVIFALLLFFGARLVWLAFRARSPEAAG